MATSEAVDVIVILSNLVTSVYLSLEGEKTDDFGG